MGADVTEGEIYESTHLGIIQSHQSTFSREREVYNSVYDYLGRTTIFRKLYIS